MNGTTREPVHLPTLPPRMPQPGVERIIEKPVKPSLFRQVGVSVLGNVGFHVLTGNLSWGWIPFVMAGLLGIIGWKVSPPRAIAEKARSIEQRIEETADKVAGHVEDKARDAATGVMPPLIIGTKTEAEREAERLRKEQKERNALLARAEIVKLACDPEWTLEMLRAKVEQAEREVKEAPEREILYDKADKVGLEADPAWDLKTLRQMVWDAEEDARLDADYQAKLRNWERAKEAYLNMLKHGPNSRCPYCTHAMRINPAWAKKDLQCPRCRSFFNGYRALALWVKPPPPREPLPPQKKPPSWFKRNFG